MNCPEPIRQLLAERSLRLCRLLRVGSKAYGIDRPGSDDDFLGTYVGPLRGFLSIHGPGRETFTANQPDFTLHEIGKYCRLALQGNPAVLESLWMTEPVVQDSWGAELAAVRHKFLHRGSLRVYGAYARAQMDKMMKGRGLHSKGGSYNPKFGAHLVRLLHAGVALGERGEVIVRVQPDLANKLREIRNGAFSMGEVLEIAGPLLGRLEHLALRNALPERPDLAAVEDLVIRARLSEGLS